MKKKIRLTHWRACKRRNW